METPLSAAKTLVKLSTGLIGQAPWQVNLGHGTSTTFDFGERQPPLRSGGLFRGSVHLWISGAAWRIERSSVVLAGSDDAGSVMVDGLRKLEGVTVRSVQVPSSTRDLVIKFHGSIVFHTFRCSTEEDAWRFFTPGEVLFLDRTGEFRLELSDPAS